MIQPYAASVPDWIRGASSTLNPLLQNAYVNSSNQFIVGQNTIGTIAGNSADSSSNSSSYYSGIFKYLGANARLSGYGSPSRAVGVYGTGESAGTGGGPGTANIGIAGFATHNLVGSVGGVWALYGTVVRQTGTFGSTQGIEIDVANFGSTVPLYPHAMFTGGLSAAAWLCTGGETTNNSSPGTVSCAIGIIQNDSQTVKTAKFEKGIVFHNTAIAGADGTGGSNIGTAVAFASGHAMQWFNNSGQIVAEVVSSSTTSAGYRLDFGGPAVVFQDRNTGRNCFQVQQTASAANGITIVPTVAGSPPQVGVVGTDTDADLMLVPKGAGLLRFGAITATADAPVTGYVSIRDAAGTIRKLAVIA